MKYIIYSHLKRESKASYVLFPLTTSKWMMCMMSWQYLSLNLLILVQYTCHFFDPGFHNMFNSLSIWKRSHFKKTVLKEAEKVTNYNPNYMSLRELVVNSGKGYSGSLVWPFLFFIWCIPFWTLLWGSPQSLELMRRAIKLSSSVARDTRLDRLMPSHCFVSLFIPTQPRQPEPMSLGFNSYFLSALDS